MGMWKETSTLPWKPLNHRITESKNISVWNYWQLSIFKKSWSMPQKLIVPLLSAEFCHVHKTVFSELVKYNFCSQLQMRGFSACKIVFNKETYNKNTIGIQHIIKGSCLQISLWRMRSCIWITISLVAALVPGSSFYTALFYPWEHGKSHSSPQTFFSVSFMFSHSAPWLFLLFI